MRKTRDWRTDEERVIKNNQDKTAAEVAAILEHRSKQAVIHHARKMGIMLPSRTKRMAISSKTLKTLRTMVKHKGLEETARRLGLKPETLKSRIYPA